MQKKGLEPEFSEFVAVTVRSRIEGEDIRAYVQEVARIVGIAHRSRNCKETSCALILPVNEEKGVGYD